MNVQLQSPTSSLACRVSAEYRWKEGVSFQVTLGLYGEGKPQSSNCNYLHVPRRRIGHCGLLGALRPLCLQNDPYNFLGMNNLAITFVRLEDARVAQSVLKPVPTMPTLQYEVLASVFQKEGKTIYWLHNPWIWKMCTLCYSTVVEHETKFHTVYVCKRCMPLHFG